jgi:hypothetical protein
MKKRSIFVSNFSGINLNDALRYLEGEGEVVYVTEGKTSIFNHDSLVRRIQFELKPMTSDDVILIAGNSVIAVYVISEVISRFGFANILIWDHNKPGYRLRTLNEKEKV